MAEVVKDTNRDVRWRGTSTSIAAAEMAQDVNDCPSGWAALLVDSWIKWTRANPVLPDLHSVLSWRLMD